MAAGRRTPTISAVLLFLLINGAPSDGQTVMLTTTLGATSIAPSATMLPSTPKPFDSTETPSSPTVLPEGAIIGIAVGGGALLIGVLVLCLCICVCCLCRRKKRYDPSATEKLSLEGASPSYHTLTPPDLSSDLVKSEEFEMQPNVALSVEDGDAESPGHNIKPTELFAVKKSHSSSNIRETRLNSEAVTNPASVASSVPSVQQPPELKGYVQMSSAGSVRLSKSLGDVAGLTAGEEQDVGIYVEPDCTGASILMQSGSYHDPPPGAPPMLHPKTQSIIAAENTVANTRHEPTLAPTEEVGGVDDYVAPDVFRIDRQTQEEIDSYYNKDTIESIRQGRGLSNVIDPSDALYTSVNSSTPTPSPHHNNTDSVEDDHLGNREEFLSGSVAKSSTAVATVVATAGELDSPEEGYYNVKHRADDGDEEDDYYNSVPGASSSQPLLDPEDNQYIYIQNSDVPRPAPPVAASAGKPTVAAKPRHLSSPVAQPKKKYINLGPNQRQILQEKVRGTSVKTTAEEPAPVPMPMANGGTTEAEADVDDSADQPLYENLRDEEEEDVGGREIYENIMR